MGTNINEKLKNLKIEDLIWITYFFLALASLISNQLERDSLIQTGRQTNPISQKINVTIFAISFIIYIYFAYINWCDIEQIKYGISEGKERSILESQARLVAALLFIVGGTIYLISEATNREDTEIGFI